MREATGQSVKAADYGKLGDDAVDFVHGLLDSRFCDHRSSKSGQSGLDQYAIGSTARTDHTSLDRALQAVCSRSVKAGMGFGLDGRPAGTGRRPRCRKGHQGRYGLQGR